MRVTFYLNRENQLCLEIKTNMDEEDTAIADATQDGAWGSVIEELAEVGSDEPNIYNVNNIDNQKYQLIRQFISNNGPNIDIDIDNIPDLTRFLQQKANQSYTIELVFDVDEEMASRAAAGL